MSFVYPGTLTTEVKGSRNEPSCTFYDIQVQYHDATWLISKRFSDFDTLREKLSELMSNLPALPAKTFLRSIEPTFLKERQVQLNKWLMDVNRLPAVANSPEFLAFLQVGENVELKELVVPKLIKTIVDPQFGVNDFVYHESQSVVFSTCEEAFALSRLDTKLTNIKMPWEKKSAITIPLGSFNCWRMDAAREWKLTTTLYFDCQVSTVFYEPEKQYVILGLENGHVICYTVDDAFSEFVMSQEVVAHSDRVTGLIYHPDRDLVISCSRDKTLYLYDLGKRACISSLTCGASWISSMAFDPVHSRVFLANYGQQIIVVDVGKVPPAIIHTLVGHQASVRCLHYQSKDRYLFSGGFDCRTGIWEIHENITRSRNVGWLVDGPPQKVKSVLFCPSATIVVTGYEDGFLAIWNTLGILLHVVRAHKYAVNKLQWIDSAFVLVTGSSDGKIKFWQFPGREEEQKTS